MSKKKIIAGFLIALIVVALQVGAVFAAPLQQTTTPPATSTPAPTTGTVTNIQIVTDSTGTQVVQVTMDVNGTSQTFDVSLTTAAGLQLVVTDSSGNQVPNTALLQTQITLQSTDILNGGTTSTTPTNPVAGLIQGFFNSAVIGDKTITELHDEGNGFGVIAQACFMAQDIQMQGGSATCSDILQAKQKGDYTGLLPADFTGPTPTNWGQFRKDLLKGTMDNLGGIVSHRLQPTTNGGTTSGGTGGAGGSTLSNNSGSPTNDLPKSKGSGHGKGHGHGKGNPNNGNGD